MAERRPTVEQLRLRPQLSDVTRKQRTLLLFVSAAGIVMAHTGLVPTKITNFGIEFSPADRETLLRLFAGVVIYFLVAFVVYAASDLASWGLDINVGWKEAFEEWVKAREEADRRRSAGELVVGPSELGTPSMGGYTPVVLARVVLDLLVPVILALYAAAVLLF